MGKTIWDRFAPVYSFAMKSQKKIYDYMYKHIGDAAAGKVVLELATGPGLIANHIADKASKVVATDFSPEMINQAKKNATTGNVVFEIADASDLSYADKSFDVVVIANALHVIPNPEKVLSEIDRVLKDGGLLICPTYIHRSAEKKENLWAKLLKALGVSFAHQWTAEEFAAFIQSNSWKITASEVVPGRIDLMYAECVRLKEA
ncbi:MAG: class I SAM-dependent methyltransferase [Treponema sp.]|nr:class I SAM-dependent methyltransferase [Treponema sp.]